MSNMPETANMNRQMFIEWFPQIMYNHHQTGPAGAVVFVPPFRDPFNYNFDPLIPLGIEAVGTAMHTRLVERGMGGSAMRSGSNYSTWWNGGLRTTAYFHNMIGILTEIIGSPNPQQIPLVPDKQLPQGDWPLPVVPQVWHYRQSIDYDVQLNRAILDYASRNRETLLFNIWQMGENSIKRGSQDNWTITPKRIEALRAAMPAGRGGRGGVGGADAAPSGDVAPGGGGSSAPAASTEFYEKILHDPALKDPRGFIIPADQADFATATKFVNSLIKNGIEVQRASSAFQLAGKTYPANSFVVRAAQAGRPFIMDMFQPQDHPNDFRYPGGPPIPPYDIAGWTLAYQMGVQFDRIPEAFDGPFTKIAYGKLQPMPVATVSGAGTPAGYLISHQNNNSFILVNRLLKGMEGDRTLSYVDAVREATDQEMGRDPSVVLFGLDVDDPKAIQGTTRGLLQKHGAQRVFGTPLSEDAMTGVAIGMALAGQRPIHVHIRMDFLMLAMNQLVNVAAKSRYMFGGKVSVPMVVRCMIGKSWGQGAQHSQGLYSFFMHVPGIKVCAPTTPLDAKGCLTAAIRDDNPVI
ncbi:MAG: hypothetical protein ACHP79_07685, partial [Terriglobales bacterium]